MKAPRIAAALLMISLCVVPARLPAQGVSGAGAMSVTRATLPNGLRVVVLRDTLAPVVSTFMNYEVGSDDEPITGLAHASEHMMFRGSKTLSASQFAAITALTGGAFNADTQSEITQYFYTMPSQDLDVALRLEAARATGVLDTQDLWDQERGAISQEVTRDNSDADYRLYVKVLHHLFDGTPYADEGLGTLESFGKQINAPQIQAFRSAWYHPNNAIYVIAGNVDPQSTIAKVRELFGSIPAQQVPAHKPVALPAVTPATYTDQTDQPLTDAFLSYRFPGYGSPDYAASQILIDVLNSRRGDLFGLVASGKAVDASAQAQTFPEAGMAMIGLSVNANVDPHTALDEIRSVVDGYRTNGVPADLVDAAKQREIARAQFERNSVSGLARQWSQALAVEHRTPDDDLAAIARVSASDVNRVLRTYLIDATATSAYATPQGAAAGGRAASAASGGGATEENNTVVPASGTQLPAWANRLVTNLQVPEQTIRPTTTTLENGLKLIVVPENVSDTVTVHGVIRNNPGLQEPQGQEGVAGLTAALMPYGTATYDRVSYQRALDQIAATVATGTNFSLNVLTPQFERGMQLLADGELHPAFPAGAFSIVKSRAYRTAQAEEHAPGHLAAIATVNALFPAGDPARRYATPDSIQRVTLDDVKGWYTTAYRPDLTTIVVVGDISPQRARDVVERWFGGWRANGPTPQIDPSPVPNNAASQYTVPAFGRVQSSVSLTETLRLRRADPDVAPLRVANTVLSGGFYASMLFHDLREVNGLVYTVTSSLGLGKTRSTFSIAFGCDPQNVDRAQTMALADLRQLLSTTLSVDRINRAKALLMAALPLREQSVNGIAGELLGDAVDGLPLDQGILDARAELRATPDDVRAAMARWIRPNDFVRVVQAPGG